MHRDERLRPHGPHERVRALRPRPREPGVDGEEREVDGKPLHTCELLAKLLLHDSALRGLGLLPIPPVEVTGMEHAKSKLSIRHEKGNAGIGRTERRDLDAVVRPGVIGMHPVQPIRIENIRRDFALRPLAAPDVTAQDLLCASTGIAEDMRIKMIVMIV